MSVVEPEEEPAVTAILDVDEILEPEKDAELTEETILAVVEQEEEVDKVASELLEGTEAKEEPKTLAEIAQVTAELYKDPAKTAALDPIEFLEREEEIPDEVEVEALHESKELKETEPQILEEDQLPEVAEEFLVEEKPVTASIKKEKVRKSKSVAKPKRQKKESERAQQITANLLGMISPENINPVSPNVDIESN
jgi:hypothetical protein